MSAGRNLIVALTVLGAMVALGWMIIKFGGTVGGFAAGGGHTIQLELPRVDGLSEGGRVVYRGKTVGRVDRIQLSESRTGFDIGITVTNDQIPANVIAVVRAINPISGGAVLDLELIGNTAESTLFEVATIEGRSELGGLLPPEVPILAGEVSALVQDVRERQLISLLAQQIEKLGELTDSINAVAGDEQLVDDLRGTLASARRASDAAAEAAEVYRDLGRDMGELQERAVVVMDDVQAMSSDAREITASTKVLVDEAQSDVDAISSNVLTSLTRADRLLASSERVVGRLEGTDGTLGLLLNDSAIYRVLEDDLRILGELLKDVRRVVEQIEEEGVSVDIFP
ncbi:MAG: MlaD family protein [Planctomycetota bacterium]